MQSIPLPSLDSYRFLQPVHSVARVVFQLFYCPLFLVHMLHVMFLPLLSSFLHMLLIILVIFSTVYSDASKSPLFVFLLCLFAVILVHGRRRMFLRVHKVLLNLTMIFIGVSCFSTDNHCSFLCAYQQAEY